MLSDPLKHFIKKNKLSTFFLDASGVLYNNLGTLPHIPNVIKALQKIGSIYIITNNSYLNVSDIAKKFQKNNLSIDKESIVSSGMGLELDPAIVNIIHNKPVYIFGSKSSHQYVKKVVSKVVDSPQEAAAIILTSSLKENHETRFDTLQTYLKKNPKPVICCNPDKVVKDTRSLKKVIGYYANQLEKNLNTPLHWIGKPLPNFSKIITQKIQFNPTSTLFVDDNLENVIALKKHLGIHGCWITQTGISYRKNIHKHIQSLGQPDLILKKFQ